MPLETIAGAGCTSRREAGTTAANLGLAPTWAKICAVFFVLFALLFAVTIATFERCENAEDGGEKIKGRPGAAGEKIAEADILSRNYQ
jgi:hypothetical protein